SLPIRGERLRVRDIVAKQRRRTMRFDPNDGDQVALRAAGYVANGCH
ncbi:MAG: hypothetical protein GWN58_41900, partial [Anaerolineae bacterium]|nr:hypothetical protein [Anaerolineae bacterium]